MIPTVQRIHQWIIYMVTCVRVRKMGICDLTMNSPHRNNHRYLRWFQMFFYGCISLGFVCLFVLVVFFYRMSIILGITLSPLFFLN